MASPIVGMDKLVAQLTAIGQIKTDAPSRDAAEVILKRAQEIVPVKTGELRDSGYVKETENGAEVGFDSDHAAPVEFGTSRMRAQPYLRPAIDETEKEALKAAAEKVQDEIKDAIA